MLKCVKETVYRAPCPGAQESRGSLPMHGGPSSASWSSFCSLAYAFRAQSDRNGRLRRCCTGPWGRNNSVCKSLRRVLQNPQKVASLSLSTQGRRPVHHHPNHQRPEWSHCWLPQLLQPPADFLGFFGGSFCYLFASSCAAPCCNVTGLLGLDGLLGLEIGRAHV